MCPSAWCSDGWDGGLGKMVSAFQTRARREVGTGRRRASTPGIGAIRLAIRAGRAAALPAAAATGAGSVVAVPGAAAPAAAGERTRFAHDKRTTGCSAPGGAGAEPEGGGPVWLGGGGRFCPRRFRPRHF